MAVLKASTLLRLMPHPSPPLLDAHDPWGQLGAPGSHHGDYGIPPFEEGRRRAYSARAWIDTSTQHPHNLAPPPPYEEGRSRAMSLQPNHSRTLRENARALAPDKKGHLPRLISVSKYLSLSPPSPPFPSSLSHTPFPLSLSHPPFRLPCSLGASEPRRLERWPPLA